MADTEHASVLRRRTVHVDGRDLVSHLDVNPAELKMTLPNPIHGVVDVRLTSFAIPYSPTFLVIRVSGEDDFTDVSHVEAVKLVKQYAKLTTSENVLDGYNIPVMATIYNDDSTVALTVIECFTFRESARDYDVYVCTGTVATTARTGWSLSVPNQSGETGVVVELTPSGESGSLTVVTIQETIRMNLLLGANHAERLTSGREVIPKWASFRFYRVGEYVIGSDGATYKCEKNHMSLIFLKDLESKNWTPKPGVVLRESDAHNAFMVLSPDMDNQGIIESASRDEDIHHEFPGGITVEHLTIGFANSTGRPFIFPSAGVVEFLNFAPAPLVATKVAVIHKMYEHVTVELELTYIDESAKSDLVQSQPAYDGSRGSRGSRYGLDGSSLLRPAIPD